jgi:uncharacterized SAM-binding protein YcdF (DUF218 family)
MSETAFLLKKILSMQKLPPTSLLLLSLVGLLLWKRLPRFGKACAWIGVAGLLLLSSPFVSRILLRALDVAPALDRSGAQAAQAIVILGGGARLGTAEYGDTLSSASLERIRYGAKLAHEYRLPVLVSGGSVYGGTPEGELMQRALRDEFGVAVRWVENRSRDTHDNAQFSAQLLTADGVRTILLVTHDMHQMRSLAEFRAAGLQPIAAPITSFTPSSYGTHSFVGELPNAETLGASDYALHEIIGRVMLALR